MAIENCKRCGTLFNKTIKDICSTCINDIEEAYKKVRMYIKRHKTAELTTVSKETEVDLELIYQFLREGRIVLSEGTSVAYPCKQCGTSIQTGSICASCEGDIHDMQRSLQSAAQSVEAPALQPEVKKGAFHARN